MKIELLARNESMNLYIKISSIVFLTLLLQSCAFSSKSSSQSTNYDEIYSATCPNGVLVRVGSMAELEEVLKIISSKDDYIFVDLYPSLNPPQCLHPDTIVNTSIVAKLLEEKGYERLGYEVSFIHQKDDGAVVSLAYGTDKYLYFVKKFYQKVDVESASSYKLLIYEQVKCYER